MIKTKIIPKVNRKNKTLKLNKKFDVNSSLIFSFCHLFELKKFLQQN